MNYKEVELFIIKETIDMLMSIPRNEFLSIIFNELYKNYFLFEESNGNPFARIANKEGAE